MKYLEINGQHIGPFNNIERSEETESWIADGIVYPDSITGGLTLLDSIPTQSTIEVPKEITMRQARLALLGAGLLDDVATAIAAMPEPMKSAANIEWEYSNTVLRHNGFVSQLGPMLGLTDEQIDLLFIQAALL